VEPIKINTNNSKPSYWDTPIIKPEKPSMVVAPVKPKPIDNKLIATKAQIPNNPVSKVVIPGRNKWLVAFTILCLAFICLVTAGSFFVINKSVKVPVLTEAENQKVQNTYNQGSDLYDQAFMGTKDGTKLNADETKAVYGQAIQELDTVLKAEPTNSEALNKIVSAYYKIGDYVSAEKYLLQYIPYSPENTYLLNLLAYTYGQEKKYSLAEESYKKSLVIDPMNINTYLDFTELYIAENKKSEAIDLLNTGLQNLPDNVGLKEKLTTLNK
jgi:hypothetical protein